MFVMKRGFVILLHVAVWLAIILIPMFFLPQNMELQEGWIWRNLVFSTPLAVVFYFNYFIGIPNFFLLGKYARFILTNLGLISVGIVCGVFLRFSFPQPQPPFEAKNEMQSSKAPPEFRNGRGFPLDIVLMRDGTTFLLALGVAVALRASSKIKQEEERRKALENENLKSEIDNLKYQLQPHFFFNNLNTIYALVEEEPQKAKEIIHKLGKLMRYVLYKTDSSVVSIKDEINFIRNFIALMTERLPSHVKLETSIKETLSIGYVPPLLFVSLIENAFKHGIHATQDSFVKIELSIKDNEASLLTSNSYFPKQEEDRSESGIGLINLEKRLKHHYPSLDYTFKHFVEKDTFKSELSIKIQDYAEVESTYSR